MWCLRRIFAYSSAVLSWLGVVALLVFSFLVLIASFACACLHVWTCGWLVGWLVGCGVRAGRGLVAGRLVSAWWVPPRARVLLRVFGWVGDVEGVAFLEELFGL